MTEDYGDHSPSRSRRAQDVRIALRINEACAALGIGRSSLYELIATGRLRSSLVASWKARTVASLIVRTIRSACPLVQGWDGLGQPVLDTVFRADGTENMGGGAASGFPVVLDELHAVVVQDRAVREQVRELERGVDVSHEHGVGLGIGDATVGGAGKERRGTRETAESLISP